MSESEHAPLAPSSSEQWVHCTGSLIAQASAPNPETESTREGDATHWVGGEVLLAHKARFAGRSCGKHHPEEYLGGTAPNGVVIDQKMVDGAATLVEDVLETIRKHPDACIADLLVEQRVNMPDIHPQNWGTLDVSLFIGRGTPTPTLYAWEYKNGYRDVRAFENWQLIDYCRGLCNHHGINGHEEQSITAVLRVVQPFAYHSPGGPIDDWVVPLSDLRPFWNRLSSQAAEVFSNPTLSPGLWCRDCRAVWECSAGRRYVYTLIDLAGQPYAMDSMTGADLAVERQIIKDGLEVAKKRLEAIEDQLHHQIRGGRTDSGLVLETSNGREEWTVSPAQAIALAGQFGVDIATVTAKTPTQTRQAAPKEVRPILAEIMKSFTKRKSGSLNLIPVSDSRVARAFQRRK